MKEKPAFLANKWGSFSEKAIISDLLVGDFNADRVSDFAAINEASKEIIVGLSDKKGSFHVKTWGSYSFIPTKPQVLIADANLDSAKDLILFDRSSGEAYVALSNGKDSFHLSRWARFPSIHSWLELASGDFNGDGRSDVVALAAKSNVLWVGLSDGNRTFNLSRWHYGAFNPKLKWHALLVFDSNLDGFDDVLVRRGSAEDDTSASVWVRRFSNGSNRFLKGREVAAGVRNELRKDTWGSLYIGDLDGDDIHDFIVLNTLTNTWDAHLFSKDQDWARSRQWALFPLSFSFGGSAAGDFNGDGLLDLSAWSKQSRKWWFAISDGTTGVETSIETGFPKKRNWNNVQSADFNGDGFSDILAIDSENNKLWVALSDFVEPEENALLSISTGDSTKTLADGFYHLKEIPAGRHTLIAKRNSDALETRSKVLEVSSTKSYVQDFVFLGTYGQAEYPGPFVCLGYRPGDAYKWGHLDPYRECPAGYAVFAVDDASSSFTEGSLTPLSFTCCRLPFEDILSDDHIYVSSECPENHVCTGGNSSQPKCREDNCVRMIRCTRINTEKYRLGDAVPGRYWGYGFSMWGEVSSTTKVDIPIALRYALGRKSFQSWDEDGCIGSPAGSLLVGKKGGQCKNVYFKELYYRTIAGDPKRELPVNMLPDCKSISSPYDVHPVCEK